MTFAKPDKGDMILSIARNEEKDEPEEAGDTAANGAGDTAANGAGETVQSDKNVNNPDEA